MSIHFLFQSLSLFSPHSPSLPSADLKPDNCYAFCISNQNKRLLCSTELASARCFGSYSERTVNSPQMFYIDIRNLNLSSAEKGQA